MRNILLPTDFSDNAWSAAVYAFKLYQHEECTFYFLHSSKLTVSRISSFSNKLLEVMKENALTDLKELNDLAAASNANANHIYKTIFSPLDIIDAIETSVKRHKIDMVIMGSKGATGAKGFLFGSNTVRIIKKVKDCPVLAVPDKYDFTKPKQIAFPTAFKRFYSQEELQYLKDLAELFNAKIRVVHINDEEHLDDLQDYNYTMLKDYLKDHDHSFHWLPDYAKKNEEIKEFVKDLNIDLLVMINYEHGFIESIIKEPVIKKLGFDLSVPFLVVPETITESDSETLLFEKNSS